MIRDIWSVILIAGLTGWLFSSIMLMLKAFPKKDVFILSSGIRWGTASILCFFIWVAGLLNA